MATDSTELTFVRCPSCRSLVPAVSTRCRMCGAGLEEDEMNSGSEASDFSTPESALESTDSESDADFDDPLGAYLEDFEDDEEQLVGDEEQESEDEGFAGETKASAPLREFSEDEDVIEDIQFDAEEDFVAATDLVESASGSIETSVAPAMTGAMKGGSESSKRFPSRSAYQDAPAEKIQEPEASSSPTHQEPQFERDESRSWRAQQRQARRREPVPPTPPSREIPLPERSAPLPEENRAPGRERAAQQSLENEGILHGWLVNFSDPKGVGYELREGKFFVSHTPLKANDFVLNHPSVSTPHALMTLSDEYGLLVQDLMSETGVFVRREGDAIYRKEEEAVILGHGDWIRFGEEEFLVTLIPSLPRG